MHVDYVDRGSRRCWCTGPLLRKRIAILPLKRASLTLAGAAFDFVALTDGKTGRRRKEDDLRVRVELELT